MSWFKESLTSRIWNSTWFQGALTFVGAAVIDAIIEYNWTPPIDWDKVLATAGTAALLAVRLYVKTAPKDR